VHAAQREQPGDQRAEAQLVLELGHDVGRDRVDKRSTGHVLTF